MYLDLFGHIVAVVADRRYSEFVLQDVELLEVELSMFANVLGYMHLVDENMVQQRPMLVVHSYLLHHYNLNWLHQRLLPDTADDIALLADCNDSPAAENIVDWVDD